ncbi:NAD dependent epimerase/dehydratase [Apiospora kogelbergensis]|uniref:NAD dependent epimerase/dehydratase n=1 Tax=Apiospora kogelbergensis TaxID=1337665 RepID=A0AAW0QVM4_9PEZI
MPHATPTPTTTSHVGGRQPDILDTFDARKVKEIYNLEPHPETGRLIDSHPGTRTRPMKVLCLGMSRTGTMSLFHALQKLGYNPYHMAVAIMSPRTSLSLWGEALRAKFHGEGPGWGRAEFDRLLGDYDGVSDVPCNLFAEELLAAYPDAKVVLQTRDVEPWLRSMDNTAGVVNRWRSWETVAAWDPSLAGPFVRFRDLVCPIAFRTVSDFSSADTPARQAFVDHYAHIRRVVPEDRLLEYKVQDGWGPLCEFLGEEVPDEPMPHVNDAQQFVFAHGLMWWLAFGKMVGKVSLMVGVPAAGIVAAVWWRRTN